MYVGTSELHFCSPHWIQKYLSKKTVSLCKTPLSYITPMHSLPLFCPTPCMPSPYSIPPHACPPPILSHPMHALPLCYPTHACPPLFFPTSCIPSPLFYSTWCIPSPLFYPTPCIPCSLFYPSPCIPSPYSIPAHAHPPPILSQPIHTQFYSTPHMPSTYSIPLYAYPLLFSTSPHNAHILLQYSIPAHACSLTPCHMNLEGMFLLWHLRMLLLNLLTLSISSSFIFLA